MKTVRRTREQINADINAIFAKHGITPVPGEEGFCLAVGAVRKLSAWDANRLWKLAGEWEVSPS